MSDSNTKPGKLVLVDAYSLLFRAFFGGRGLTTTDNRPTGALFGFSGMLLSILSSEQPDAMVVCWDAHRKTHRSEQFEAYKAHRPDADPQLKAQMPIARDIVAAFGIQSAEVGGYEADDLIGTLAERGVAQGYTVTILTGDTDQLQLVNDSVTVQMTQRGVTETKTYDKEAVRTRYGLEPERIPDWKALVGDTSDNIPGVPGIGDKTATALLQQFQTVGNLLEHVSEVAAPRTRAALEQYADQARLSLKLATIHCSAPLDLEIAPYRPSAEDWARVREIFTGLEFRSLIARLPRPAEDAAPGAERLAPGAVFPGLGTLISTEAEWAAALKEVRQSGSAALLVDTDAALPMRAELRGVAFAPTAGAGYYAPFRASASKSSGEGLFGGEADAGFAATPDMLRDLLAADEVSWTGHNAKFAEIVLDRSGARPRPFKFDTLVAAYLLSSGRSAYPLPDLAESYLGQRLESADTMAPGEKLAREAAAVQALRIPLEQQLQELGMAEVMNNIEMPLVPVLAEIEEAGILVDTVYLDGLAETMGAKMDGIANEIYEIAGEKFNIGSTKQLQTILFDRLQLPTGKKIKTGFSTGSELLEALAPQYDIARKILDYREVSKLKVTYADALPKLVDPVTARVHTSLNQTVASTGRLSSSDPNLQNIPIRSESGRTIRKAFIAPQGRILLSCDYSQIELRILAHITGDPLLTKAFELDEDIHAATAASVFEVPLEEVTPDQRRQAKTINFAVIYGQSGFSLAATLGVSAGVANAWIKEYFERLPGVQKYVDQTAAMAHREKYVSTLAGRRRYFPELDSGNHAVRQAAERAAVNMPIQGTAADIMKLAMIDVRNAISSRTKECTLILQVHDELLLEVDEAHVDAISHEVVRHMEAAFPLKVPLRVDAKAGCNWAEMKPLARHAPASA